MLSNAQEAAVWKAMDGFKIEVPSWGFADTGTRFGKFLQAGGGDHDRGEAQRRRPGAQVHRLLPDAWRCTCCGISRKANASAPEVQAAGCRSTACEIGAINPNVFQDQIYKYGSLGNPDAGGPRRTALDAHPGLHRDLRARPAAATCRCGSPTARTIPGTANIRAPQAAGSQEGLQAGA